MLIHEIYKKNPHVIKSDQPVKTALKMLLEHRINGLIVLNNDEKVVGVLSLQDIAAATVPTQFQRNPAMAAAMYKKGFFTEMCEMIMDKSVKTIMRRNFEKVSLEDNIMTIAADFLENDLYLVPVIEDKKLIGIVTRSEIKKALAYGMGITK